MRAPVLPIELPALASRVPDYTEVVFAFLPQSVRTHGVRAAIAEAIANAIIHGALDVSSSIRDERSIEDYLHAIVQAEAAFGSRRSIWIRPCARAGQIGVTIADGGRGLPQATDAARGAGWGLRIIRAACADVEWNETRNAVTLWIST